MSKEQIYYLKKIKRNNIFIKITRLFLLVIIIILWQILSDKNIINSFFFSSPKKILICIYNLYKNNNLIYHIWITFKELIISFSLGTIIAFILAIILYFIPTLKKIIDPFINVFNSLPKVSLGPLLIIWLGANTKSIIIMSLLINVIVTFNSIYNGFINTDYYRIKMFKTFKANKLELLIYLIIPHNKENILNGIKLNISMSLIGIIMGEFLVSKAGIGYLILYGTQIFNLDIVMSGIVLIMILSLIIYEIINLYKKI